MQDHVRIHSEQLLADDWHILKKTTFDVRRRDGRWQTLTRETYDRGNGATALLYDPKRRTVLLTRQFRFPAYVNGHDGFLIEAAAGLLDQASPDQRIRAELEEETGRRVGQLRQVFDVFMSPGSVTERLHFFVGEYDPGSQVSQGGGLEDEGEDIEVLELDADEALAMVARGEIMDGKTIMLLPGTDDDRLRSGGMHYGQRQPFSQYRHVTALVQRQRARLHCSQVGRDALRIVVGA